MAYRSTFRADAGTQPCTTALERIAMWSLAGRGLERTPRGRLKMRDSGGAAGSEKELISRGGMLARDHVGVMLHLRSLYVSKAAILTISAFSMPVENRSPA